MLVKELIALLEKQDENALVLVSSDEEGNAFSKLAYGFGSGDLKTDPDFVTNEMYGLEPQDMDKEYIILYPEL